MALILSNSDDDIKKASDKILNNELVIFPTETVYGIGGNALNKTAIDKIYQVKKRPKDNPLIMHVLNWEMAEMFTNLTEIENTIINNLIELWPGPLTFLVKCSKHVLPECNNNSGMIAIRSPNHKFIRKLISNTNVPIVAPSANFSGKVSPSCYEHVEKSFKNYENMTIIKDKEPCKYGIESTIVKITSNIVTIVRPGIILKEDIEKKLSNLDVIVKNYQAKSQQNYPGSNISHYTIDKDLKLVNFYQDERLSYDKGNQEVYINIYNSIRTYLQNCIFVDFNGINKDKMDLFYGYVDLSETGECQEALYNLYNVLHQLDKIDGCNNVLIFNFYKNKEGYYQVLYDRLFRCCSGKEMLIPIV